MICVSGGGISADKNTVSEGWIPDPAEPIAVAATARGASSAERVLSDDQGSDYSLQAYMFVHDVARQNHLLWLR